MNLIINYINILYLSSIQPIIMGIYTDSHGNTYSINIADPELQMISNNPDFHFCWMNENENIRDKNSDVSIIVDLFNEWKKVTSEIEDAVELINSEEDEDMKNEFESIVTENKNKLEPLVQKIKVSLLPKDPLDEKDVLVEIRPGAGGEEAAIWVGDLYKMYTRFAERNAWNVDVENNRLLVKGSVPGRYESLILIKKSS